MPARGLRRYGRRLRRAEHCVRQSSRVRRPVLPSGHRRRESALSRHAQVRASDADEPMHRRVQPGQARPERGSRSEAEGRLSRREAGRGALQAPVGSPFPADCHCPARAASRYRDTLQQG